MDAKWYRQLGARIARFRTHAALTQEQLAEKADIAPSYLARIEAGTRHPTLDVLGRLAQALGIQLHRLVADERAATRAAEGQETWGRPAQKLVAIVHELSDADVDLLARVASRLRGQ